jgi:hypothetical protein
MDGHYGRAVMRLQGEILRRAVVVSGRNLAAPSSCHRKLHPALGAVQIVREVAGWKRRALRSSR